MIVYKSPRQSRINLPFKQIVNYHLKYVETHGTMTETELNDLGYKLGQLTIEGKTKKVYEILNDTDHVVLINKDRITAGDGVKAHDLAGKAEISNATNAKVFGILNNVGVKTSFVKQLTGVSFLSRKCEMIPIEWVTRRLATGSFLKRNVGVPEGYRFAPPKSEYFFKDDANHDPQWSAEQIVSAGFVFNGLKIGHAQVEIMRKTSQLVFEILERAWQTRDCALIDMKIEFGVDRDGCVVVADVIDSDSWRLWPSGDKRLMVDKQVYRNLQTVTDSDLTTVKRNFAWVQQQLNALTPPETHLIVIVMGSTSDLVHCQKIADKCHELGLKTEMRVTSAHKSTESTLAIVAHYDALPINVIYIAVAGRSNGLGLVLSGQSDSPVINCPPATGTLDRDVWSSLNVPSGLGCATVLYADSAALHAAQIVAGTNHLIWSRLRAKRLDTFVKIVNEDARMMG